MAKKSISHAPTQRPWLAKELFFSYYLGMKRNISIYPWLKFFQSLTFWQATWFLYFESELSAAEAVLLYIILDVTVTVLEIPSGYMSDRIGRKPTLLGAGVCAVCAAVLLSIGGGFAQFALANGLLGAALAFTSGTDSSLLYESLRAEDRSAEIESAELNAWRFSFIAMALSALLGGMLANYDHVFPYVATAISSCVALGVTTLLHEPPHAKLVRHRDNLRSLTASLTHPTLLWLFGMTLTMYVFSHVPYVFGQPFMREALSTAGYDSQTPLISGAVTFVMMFFSICVSWGAMRLRIQLGLPKLLLLAMGMQIFLIAALAISNGIFVIALLMFRMVPDSLSQPFVRARIQPLLGDGMRATYFSIQSLAGRVLFAVMLSVSAGRISGSGTLPYSDLQFILSAFVGLGLIILFSLGLIAKRSGV